MRGLIVLGLAGLGAALAANAARAATDDDPVCAAYQSNFERAAASGDLAAMDKAVQAIPAACPALEALAQGEVTAARRRAADLERAEAARIAQAAKAAAEADDAAFAAAQRTNTLQSYTTYVAGHPAGRHLAEAMGAEQALEAPPPSAPPPPPPPAASPTAAVLAVTGCNKSDVDILVATAYLPATEQLKWKYYGWIKITKGECLNLFQTRNRYFYLYAEQVGNPSRAWGDKPVDGADPSGECVVYPDAYDFSEPVNTPCPSFATARMFFTLHAPDTAASYTFNFQ